MTVRKATVGDLFWLRLMLGQLVEEKSGYPKIGPQDLETQTAILASRLGGEDPSFLCFVAEDGQQLVGFVWGDILVRTGEPRRYLFVSFFYVAPPCRGTGVGRRLSNIIIQQGALDGCQAVEFVEQEGDQQWMLRGWPTVGIVHSLPIQAALASVVPTHQPANGHGKDLDA